MRSVNERFLLVNGVEASFSITMLWVGRTIASAPFQIPVCLIEKIHSHRALKEVSIALSAALFPLPSFSLDFWGEFMSFVQ